MFLLSLRVFCTHQKPVITQFRRQHQGHELCGRVVNVRAWSPSPCFSLYGIILGFFKGDRLGIVTSWVWHRDCDDMRHVDANPSLSLSLLITLSRLVIQSRWLRASRCRMCHIRAFQVWYVMLYLPAHRPRYKLPFSQCYVMTWFTWLFINPSQAGSNNCRQWADKARFPRQGQVRQVRQGRTRQGGDIPLHKEEHVKEVTYLFSTSRKNTSRRWHTSYRPPSSSRPIMTSWEAMMGMLDVFYSRFVSLYSSKAHSSSEPDLDLYVFPGMRSFWASSREIDSESLLPEHGRETLYGR